MFYVIILFSRPVERNNITLVYIFAKMAFERFGMYRKKHCAKTRSYLSRYLGNIIIKESYLSLMTKWTYPE